MNIGDVVVITDASGHCFKVGEEVTIIEPTGYNRNRYPEHPTVPHTYQCKVNPINVWYCCYRLSNGIDDQWVPVKYTRPQGIVSTKTKNKILFNHAD